MFLPSPNSTSDCGLLVLGPVTISIDQPHIALLIAAVELIENRINNHASPDLLHAKMAPSVEWLSFGFVPERLAYNLNYRGVCWEVPRATMQSVVQALKGVVMAQKVVAIVDAL